MTNSRTSPNTNTPDKNFLGDPNCPICHGIGWIRKDLQLGDPDFGRLILCSCREKEATSASFNRLYRLSNLEAFKGMTFETFKVEGRLGLPESQINSLKSALSLASIYAHEIKNWILFTGTYGCGKTHLAAAIANFAVGYGVPTLFLTVPDLLDWLRFAYDSPDSSFEERFNEIRNIRLLVLDDLGTQNATPWAQEKLFQILNHRYINHFATVFTSNQQLDDIEGRIRSRLSDSDFVINVRITGPDYRDTISDTSHHPLSSLQHHSGRTLGNFTMREDENLSPEEQNSLQKAYNAATLFAQKKKLSGWLVFIGGYGTGKTHLAAGIGNYRHNLGETPMFVVVPDLLDHLRATFSPNSNVSYDELFNEIKTAQLLILDDLGTQSATPWAREKLYQIFNYRYVAELPTVITTTLPLKEIDPRIQSRMLDARLCTINLLTVPSFRGDVPPQKVKRPRKTSSLR